MHVRTEHRIAANAHSSIAPRPFPQTTEDSGGLTPPSPVQVRAQGQGHLPGHVGQLAQEQGALPRQGGGG